MCYPKPGPRCSSSAMKTLRNAVAAERANPTDGNKQATRDAFEAWLRTPDGIASLRAAGDKKSLDLADQHERERAEQIAAYKALVSKAKAIVEQEGVQKATGRDGAVKYYKDGELLVGEDQHDEADAPYVPVDAPLDVPSFKNLDESGGGSANMDSEGDAKSAEALAERIAAAKAHNQFGQAWVATGAVPSSDFIPEERQGSQRINVGGEVLVRKYENLETGVVRTEVFSVVANNLASDASGEEDWEYEVIVDSYVSEDGAHTDTLDVWTPVAGGKSKDQQAAITAMKEYAVEDYSEWVELEV